MSCTSYSSLIHYKILIVSTNIICRILQGNNFEKKIATTTIIEFCKVRRKEKHTKKILLDFSGGRIVYCVCDSS